MKWLYNGKLTDEYPEENGPFSEFNFPIPVKVNTAEGLIAMCNFSASVRANHRNNILTEDIRKNGIKEPLLFHTGVLYSGYCRLVSAYEINPKMLVPYLNDWM